MKWYLKFAGATLAIMLLSLPGKDASAQRPVVPGTGVLLTEVGDDFEDPSWDYIPRDPKSTEDIDENQRGPTGKTTNGRWYEGIKRGHPDIVKRVPIPEGGLPGSTHGMMLRSKFTGLDLGVPVFKLLRVDATLAHFLSKWTQHCARLAHS